MGTVKKGFYVSEVLADEWDNWLTNKQDNSASAAGAMFAFMLMPAEIQQLAKKLVKPEKLLTSKDLKNAQREFIETMKMPPETITYEVIQRALIAASKKK